MSPQVPRRRSADKKIETEIAVSRNERRRTILYSVIASGLVTLVLAHFIEVDTNNKQADRSRTNCHFINDRLKVSAERDKQQSDQTLGDPQANPPIPAADFSKPPYDSFKAFKALIILQAKQQRQQAADTLKGLKDCNETFPKEKHFWIVG